MCVTLVQLFAAMFLIVSYALIIKKYVRNKVNVGEWPFLNNVSADIRFWLAIRGVVAADPDSKQETRVRFPSPVTLEKITYYAPSIKLYPHWNSHEFEMTLLPSAGHLSDDSSKGILIAAGSYTLLSAFVPQQILIVMYLLANITIGAYMMKVRLWKLPPDGYLSIYCRVENWKS